MAGNNLSAFGNYSGVNQGMAGGDEVFLAAQKHKLAGIIANSRPMAGA